MKKFVLVAGYVLAGCGLVSCGAVDAADARRDADRLERTHPGLKVEQFAFTDQYRSTTVMKWTTKQGEVIRYDSTVTSRLTDKVLHRTFYNRTK